MKTFILSVGLCVAAIFGVAPYWFGRQAEPIFHTFVTQVEAASQLPVRTTQYHRGWFHSTAETVMTLPPQAQETLHLLVPDVPWPPGQAVVLTMSHQLFHGPFPLDMFQHGQVSLAPVQMHIATVVHLQAASTPGLPQGSATVLPGQIATAIALAGGGWSVLTLPAGHLVMTGRQPLTIHWQPLHGHVNFAANGQRLTGTFNSAKLVAQSPQGSLTAQDMQLYIEGNVEGRQRYRGQLLLRGNRLDLFNQQSDRPPVSVQGWSVHNHATVTRDSTDTTSEARVQAIQTGNTHYGPGTGTLAIRRVHTKALLTLAHTLLPLGRTESHRSTPGLLSVGGLFKMLPAFLQQAPEIELTQLSLRSSAGEIRGQAKITLDRSQGSGLLALLRPLHMFEGQGEGAAPVALLQQTLSPALLQQLARGEQQGYIVRQGESYVFSARLSRGQLLVNNKPVALSFSGG